MTDIHDFVICILFLIGKNRSICFNANIWLNSSHPSIDAKLLHDVDIAVTKCLFTRSFTFCVAYPACLLEIVDSIHVVFVGSEQGQMEYNTQLLTFIKS